jgi:hypothetical protein
VAVGCTVEKNTGVHAGDFFLTGGILAAPPLNRRRKAYFAHPVFRFTNELCLLRPTADVCDVLPTLNLPK